MPNINQLSSSTTLSDADTIPVFTDENQDTRKVALKFFADYVRQSLEDDQDATLYSFSAVGSNFTAALQPTEPGKNLWARLSPSAPASIGTFVLPVFDYRADGQEILVTSTQSVASVVFTLSGSTVIGAPTNMVAGGFFRLRYDSISNTWNRVG